MRKMMGVRKYRELWEAQVFNDPELSPEARQIGRVIKEAHGRHDQIARFPKLRSQIKGTHDEVIKAIRELSQAGYLRTTWMGEYLTLKDVPDRCTLEIKQMPENMVAPNWRAVDFGYSGYMGIV